MRDPRVARAWFGLTALAVLAGLVIQLIAVIDPEDGRFATTGQRMLNVFCFFTVQSNILVGITTGLLALRLERPAFVFRVLRLTALVSIAVTGVVYHVALSQLRELDGYGLIADHLLHTAVPLLAVIGWLLFGPRGGQTLPDDVVAWTPGVPTAVGAVHARPRAARPPGLLPVPVHGRRRARLRGCS